MWVDTINMVAFINEFTRESGLEDVDISVPKIQGILAGMRMDFPHFEGQDKASPFKKAANFICYFNAERPLANPFPASLAGDFLHQVSNHQNAIISFLYACEALHGASLHKHDCNEPCVIANPIKVSRHSFEDIIDALAVASPQSHFKIVSVLLEQLVYKTNPECQY
jgi:hypothetical protein